MKERLAISSRMKPARRECGSAAPLVAACKQQMDHTMHWHTKMITKVIVCMLARSWTSQHVCSKNLLGLMLGMPNRAGEGVGAREASV